MNETPQVRQPQTMDELREIIVGHQTVLPIGNRTKPGGSVFPTITHDSVDHPAFISLTKLSGIIEYEPSEFTFTAQAGTRVSEIIGVLKERNQYLPFDPLLVDAGATLGGTVASNVAGPGRFRYGGVRDFLLAVCLITGDGDTIRAGAKVVKNSAGFDIPKLMVGSVGRLGVMTELTFKVFPWQPSQMSIQVRCQSHEDAIEQITAAACSRWELDAIDYRIDEKAIYLRIAGPERSNQAIAAEILDRGSGNATIISGTDSDRFWTSVRELNFAGSESTIVKVPTTTTSSLALIRVLAENPLVEMHSSVAGSLIWLTINSESAIADVDNTLQQLSLAGLVVRGPSDSMWLGRRQSQVIDNAIKQAMDPGNRFPNF